MIFIDDEDTREKILSFLTFIKQKQNVLQKRDIEKVLYSAINIGYAIQHELLIIPLLTHKIVLQEKKFYEESEEISNTEEIIKILNKVIEYELTSELKNTMLNSEDLNQVIRVKKKLEANI